MKCYSDLELDTGMPEETEEFDFEEMDDDQETLDAAEDSEELDIDEMSEDAEDDADEADAEEESTDSDEE